MAVTVAMKTHHELFWFSQRSMYLDCSFQKAFSFHKLGMTKFKSIPIAPQKSTQ